MASEFISECKLYLGKKGEELKFVDLTSNGSLSKEQVSEFTTKFPETVFFIWKNAQNKMSLFPDSPSSYDLMMAHQNRYVASQQSRIKKSLSWLCAEDAAGCEGQECTICMEEVPSLFVCTRCTSALCEVCFDKLKDKSGIFIDCPQCQKRNTCK
jgi:hypothetical protein